MVGKGEQEQWRQTRLCVCVCLVTHLVMQGAGHVLPVTAVLHRHFIRCESHKLWEWALANFPPAILLKHNVAIALMLLWHNARFQVCRVVVKPPKVALYRLSLSTQVDEVVVGDDLEAPHGLDFMQVRVSSVTCMCVCVCVCVCVCARVLRVCMYCTKYINDLCWITLLSNVSTSVGWTQTAFVARGHAMAAGPSQTVVSVCNFSHTVSPLLQLLSSVCNTWPPVLGVRQSGTNVAMLQNLSYLSDHPTHINILSRLYRLEVVMGYC